MRGAMILRPVSYKRHRFPPDIISHAVWLYFRFPLSLRLVEEMLLERGILVSYETIRRWALKCASDSPRRLKRKALTGASHYQACRCRFGCGKEHPRRQPE